MGKLSEKKRRRIKRRDLLSSLWVLTGGAALIALLGSASGFLRNLFSRNQPPEKRELSIGPVSDFKPGTVTLIREGGGCFVYRMQDGGLLALSKRCTHLGCAITWNQERQQFICPCHGSSFDATGNVITAPAPRALDYFSVQATDGVVTVDLSHPRKRNGFAEEQVFRPEAE